MRVAIIGTCDTARALRGLLAQTQRYVLADSGGLVTITIREDAVDDVVVDGVDSLFESVAVTCIAELSPTGRIVLQRGGGNRNDRALVVTVPKGHPLQAHAVERGLFRALEKLLEHTGETAQRSHPSRWRGWWGLTALLLLLAPSASAQFFTTSVRTIQASGTALPSRPIVNMLGAGVSCVDDPSNGRINCTFSGGGGGGAPTGAEYWVGAADATLTAERSLGALGTGLVINTAGVPSIFGGTSCTNQFARALSALGAATCASVALGADVTGNLPVGNLGGGTGASGTTFWRGDGTWATPIDTVGAPTNVGYWVDTANATLTAERNLGGLTTGLVLNTVTTGTGVPSAYAGTSCTNQFPRSLNASGVATCASVALGADVSGNLPVGNLNGGSGASGTTFWRGDGTWAAPPGGGGAPTDATYLTTTANGTLTNEVPVGVADDTAIVANGTTWEAKALPSCSNGTTSKLLYDTATNAFSCGTDQGGAGSGLDHPTVMGRLSLGF